MALTDIITVDYLKKQFLFGVSFADKKGNQFPDAMFVDAINAAISMMERELSIVMKQNKVVVGERRDVMTWEGQTFYLMTLNHRPVITVQSFAIQFASFTKSDLPPSWIHISSPVHGQIQIMPGPEGLEGWQWSGGVPLLGLNMLMPREYTPRWFNISYTAGFEKPITGTAEIVLDTVQLTGTGTSFTTELMTGAYIKVGGQTRQVHSIEDNTNLTVTAPWSSPIPVPATGLAITHLDYDPALVQAIGLMAAIPILDTAGDLIFGPGVSSLSLSVDGLSQSLGSTASTATGAYGHRSNSYRDRVFKTIMPSLKRSYKSIRSFGI